MKTIEVKCENCKKIFNKRIGDYNSSIKRGMRHCCSRSCAISIKNKSMTHEYWLELYQKRKKYHDIAQYNRDHPNIDKYSPFRIFLRRMRQTRVIKDYGSSNIDGEYLKYLWEIQEGKCGYTGIKMLLPISTKEYMKIHSVRKISLDRIDSTKGYIKGNVHFVCQAVNLAKRNLPHNEMIEFIKEIKNAGNVPSTPKIGGDAGIAAGS